MEDRDRSMDWTKPVGIPDEQPKVRKNVTQGCFYREIGRYNNTVPSEFQWAAEDKLVDKSTYEELKCELPDSPKSTFLMVFSPDGKKVASTHGNHNVYVTDLTTGKNIQTLSGHPRTPWCIAFHPSHNQILASGCLGGQVRVWDLHGGSEVWTADKSSVIASLAFHPNDRMLVIATYNELYFWDWSLSKPFAKCRTKSEKEKVRYVTFDRLGNKLITGIANPVNTPSQWDRVSVVNTQPMITTSATTSTTVSSTTMTTTSSTLNQGRSIRFYDSYLMNQYSQLVRRYIDLSRSRITPTIDRGTDPMDLVDEQGMGNQGERARTSSMSSASQTSSNRSVRYRIMRSTRRSYRPPSSRERFRIHSSLLSGLPSRSTPSSNSLVRTTTTTTTTTSQSIIFTTIATTTTSSLITSPLSRLRQCGFGLFSARPVCLTISRENPSNLFSLRTSQPTTHSGAVTNPTYTSYSERGIFSTRESNSGETDWSRIQLIRPYRIVFDDINRFRTNVHTVIRPSNEESGGRTNPEQRINAISPLDRIDRLRSHLLDVEEVEIDRDLQRSFTYVPRPFRRLSSDSESTSTTPTNAQRPSPQQWVSHNTNHLPLHPRPVPRFQVRPTFDLNNTSPVRRSREDTESEGGSNSVRSNETSTADHPPSHSMSPVQLNAGPVPRLQIRPRYLQDQQSQLQLITNPEAPGSSSQSTQTLRRQFVLSRHSNSPFQPRIPHRIDNSMLGGSFVPTTSSSSTSSRPEIPSCMSSFVASGSSSTTRSTPSVSLPVGNVASSTSKATNTATTTIAGDDSFVRGTRELMNRLYFFDHVQILLRDRIRNSSEHGSTDSTVNYSNIANESEGESRNMLDNTLDDGNSSSGLGPRGLDPMLSSVSENTDNTNDAPLFPSTSSVTSANGESSSNTGNDLNISELEFIDPWESDSHTVPFPASPPLPPSDTASQQQQHRQNSSHREREPIQPEAGSSAGASTSERRQGSSSSTATTTSEPNVRQKIQLLSLHIENMLRLCRAKIEIVRLQQIRKMWEDLSQQIRSLHTAVQGNSGSVQQLEENENSNSSRDPVNPSVNHLMRLAISDNSPVPEASNSQSTSSETASRENNIYNPLKDVVESMVNMLLEKTKTGANPNSEPKPGTSKSATESGTDSGATRSTERNDPEEPQPGPSGLSGGGSLLNTEYFKLDIYNSLRYIISKTKKKRETEAGSSLNSSQRHSRFKLSDLSRNKFRRHRHGGHSLDPTLPRTSGDPCSTEGSADPGPSSPREDRSSNLDGIKACQSCGRKKKASKDSLKQKRRNTDSATGTEPSPSCSKMMKNNLGGRSAASTSTNTGSSSTSEVNSTSELLRKMIKRMETMVRFQREAFRRTEELTGRRTVHRPLLSSSDDSDSDSNTTGSHRPLYMRHFQRILRVTRKDVNLRRAVFHVCARRLLEYMVESLTGFFEENSDSSDNVFDDQIIISLCTLLPLALELTDLLLDQLNSTCRNLERVRRMENSNSSNVSESGDSDWLFSERSRAIRRLRERSRGLTRSSIHSSFEPRRDESSSTTFPNPFLYSSTRTDSSRLCPNQDTSRSSGSNVTSSDTSHYRQVATAYPSRYRRPKRAYACISAGVRPRRYGSAESRRRGLTRSRGGPSNVILPSRISNGDNSQLRGYPFWERRSSGDGDSDPRRRPQSDSNNNNNNVNSNNNSNNNNGTFVINSSSSSSSSNNNDDISSANSSMISDTNSNSLPPPSHLNLREQMPRFWFRYGSNNDSNSSTTSEPPQSRESSFPVPVVQVNDVPVPDVSMLNHPRYRPQSPTPRVSEDLWRWRAWRPRFLHPRYIGPHPFDDQDSNDLPESMHYYRTSTPNPGAYTLDPVIITDAPISPHHRIQAWDFSKLKIPDISDREANGVVAECKIHNDASVDVSNDGHLLVTLLPSGRHSVTTKLGVYSLDWNSLGQLLYKTSFEQNAVSVSLSPTNRHLLVGLASRPLVVRDRTNMAQIFRLEGARPVPPGGTWQSGRGRLVHVRDLEQTRETNIMSLNCIRWAPGAGQGLVYGTNTGQLKVLR